MADPMELAEAIGRQDRVTLRQWDDTGTTLTEVDATIEQISAATVQQLALNPDLIASVIPKNLSGEGAPAASLGANDDSYVDLSTGDTYRKSAGAWELIGNIRGPEGEAANQFLASVEPESADLVLTATEHNGRVVIVTIPNTFVSVADFESLGDGFNCHVRNRSATLIGFSATIGNAFGHQFLGANGTASVLATADSAGESIDWIGGPSS